MQHFFETAPQNPYIFVALVALAIVSAWQPLFKIFSATRSFYRDVVHRGLLSALQRLAHYTDRKAERICADHALGTLIILADFRWSMTLAVNAIFMFFIGIVVHMLPPVPDAPEFFFQKVFALFAFLIAGLAALLWSIESVLQSIVLSKVRSKLRQDA